MSERKTKCGGCKILLIYDDRDVAFPHKLLCSDCYQKLLEGRLDVICYYDGQIDPPEIKPLPILPPQMRNKNAQPFYRKFLK